MKGRNLILMVLATALVAAARDRNAKGGPYVFTSKASAQTLRPLIIKDMLKDGYTLDNESQSQLRFSKVAQMPAMGALFSIPSACMGVQTHKVWTYTLVELNGITTVTVQPVWEYPGDYCRTQTHELIWNKPDQIAAFQAMLDRAPDTTASRAPAQTPTSGAPESAAQAAPTPAAVPLNQQNVPTTQPTQRATQPTVEPVAGEESLGDAARRAQQRKACLELAKDNPSISCK